MAAPLGVLVVLVVVLVVGCGGDATKDESRPQPTITDEGVGSGEFVDVGGRRLFLECSGSGSPTVLLEAGFGGGSNLWADVLPELGQETRTCAYDRAGIDASDAIPGVHDAGDEIRDLERLLDRGRIEPPYVLVGHSYGGLLARLFAHTHPDQTGGVVLVDANGRDAYRRGFAVWPKTLAPKLRRAWAEPIFNGVDGRASAALASHIRSLGDTPLVVLTAARDRELLVRSPAADPSAMAPTDAGDADRVGGPLDRSRPCSRVAQRPLHPPRRQPQVVIACDPAVVRAVRDDVPLPPCEQLFSGPDVRCLS